MRSSFLRVPNPSDPTSSVRIEYEPYRLEAVVRCALSIQNATGVCERKHSFHMSLGLAVQRQKLQSSPRFGVFRADVATCLQS